MTTKLLLAGAAQRLGENAHLDRMQLAVGALDAGRSNIVARFDIYDVLLDEIGDDNIVGQRDGRGLALARLDR